MKVSKNFQKILRYFIYLVIGCVLVFCAMIGFYIYMIYGIHPSDEGHRGVMCEYDAQGKLTRVEVTQIVNAERVIMPVTPADQQECLVRGKEQ